MNKAIFLDRDGTIIKDYGYIGNPGLVELLPNAIDGLKKLIDNGFLLFIVTNQSGIAKRYYSIEDFFEVNNKLLCILADNNIQITQTYYCPHDYSENCFCRKPNPGMILKAKEAYNIDIGWMIGDKISDVEAGKNAGFPSILISESNSEYKDLLEAANYILENND